MTSKPPSPPPSTAASALWSRSLVLGLVALLGGAMVPNLFVIAPRYLGANGFDKATIGLVMGAYQVAVLAITPFVTKLARRVGFPRTIALGCALAALGAWLFAGSLAMPVLLTARGVQGLGFGIVMVGAAAYVAETAPPARLGEALGVVGIATLVAQALGPVLAEAMQKAAGYYPAFMLGVWSGSIGAVVALAMGGAHVKIVKGTPRLRAAAAPLGALALSGLGFGAAWLFVADFARARHIATIGGFFWAYIAAALVSRLALGTLADRIGAARVSAPALGLHAVAFAGLPWCTQWWHFVPIGLAYGLAHGLYYPALQAMVVARAEGPRGKSVAAANFAFGVGIITAAVALGRIAKWYGYGLMYWLAAGAAALACGWLLAERSKPPASEAKTPS